MLSQVGVRRQVGSPLVEQHGERSRGSCGMDVSVEDGRVVVRVVD